MKKLAQKLQIYTLNSLKLEFHQHIHWILGNLENMRMQLERLDEPLSAPAFKFFSLLSSISFFFVGNFLLTFY
jgi:hypothetical protein